MYEIMSEISNAYKNILIINKNYENICNFSSFSNITSEKVYILSKFKTICNTFCHFLSLEEQTFTSLAFNCI